MESKKLKTSITGVWVVIDPKGNPVLSTVAKKKKICTDLYVMESSQPWAEWEAAGWSCEKVDIAIMKAKNPNNIDVTFEAA